MEIKNNLHKQVLLLLLKEFTKDHTITTLAKELKVTRTGIWKVLKKLESQEFITLKSLGSGKTSIYIIKLKWNIITEKSLVLYLIEESMKQARWISNFEELKDILDFLIVYGSIINTPKQANDIDILGITSKNKFSKADNIIQKIQKTQIKKIHSINFTQKELERELGKNNRAFIEAIKKGKVLFGQDGFVDFMKRVYK